MRHLVVAAMMFAPLAAAAQDGAADLARLFGARETVANIQLSPEATAVLYLTDAGGSRSALIVADLKTGEERRVMNDDGRTRLEWCAWKSEQRIICYVGGEVNVGELIGVSRVVAMDRDGRNAKALGARENTRTIGFAQVSGSIVNWLPDDPDHVLMAVPLSSEVTINTRLANTQKGLSVQRVNVRTGGVGRIEPPRPNAALYQTDKEGRVRVMGEIARERDAMSSTVRYFVRGADGGAWKPLAQANMQAGISFDPEGLDDSGQWVLALKPLEGRQALYRVAADGSGREELLFKHDQVDVADVLRIGKHDRPVAAAYVVDKTEYHYLDPALAKLAAQLGRALPGQPAAQVLDESWDGSKKLVFAGSDVDPGRYYLFDSATKRVEELVEARPGLAKMKLATVRSVVYPAADGTRIPAYLTLPPGRESARGLPAIVMPHGGPSARDVWGFDWLPQFYAARGYAVLQPQYRGSAGYGDAWFVKNGFKSWAIAIGDINAGARWLVAQGTADAGKLAIVGWSYGGYAALQANVVEPGLYKAAVAVAPVTDLAMLKQDSRFFTNFSVVSDYIGTGPHVAAGSPLQNAAAIRAPVLMFHGDRDLNVGVHHAQRMADALKAAGRSVELVVYPGLEHSLVDTQARGDMLRRSAAFLDRATGAAIAAR